MASYPFLYAAAASLLPILNPFVLKHLELPDDMEKDVMGWKEILSNLPSFIETHEFSEEGFLAISKFVYGLHDLLQLPSYSRYLEEDWKRLGLHMTEFKDHYYYSKTRKSDIGKLKGFLTYLASLLPKSKQPTELETRPTRLLSSSRPAQSSLKARDVKPLDDLPPPLQRCLAYCALYPEGSTFVRETLIYQWMAEGFLIGDSLLDSSWEQVEKGNLYFNKFLKKGVFVEPMFAFGGLSSGDDDKRIHSYQIHPDIHSAVCRMTSNEVLIMPGNKQGSAAPVTTRYIALHKEDDAGIHYEFLLQPTTFMCFIPEINKVALQSLLSKFEELRVLHFAGTQFEELPTELTALRYLGYLGLSRNPLLKRLDCGQFPKLKTLTVDECVHLEKVDASGKLEILQISHCSNLKSIDNHLQESINSLHTLRIYDCPNLEISSKVLSSMINLKSIDLRNCPTIMTTTFSNDAMEELVPWIWSKDRDFIIDGQRYSTQDVGLFEETDDALEPLLPSSSAQTTEDSKGILEQALRRKMIFTAINEIKKEHKLYCCLLSSGFEFERDTLVQLWMAALGILHERLEQEQTGERCFNDLMAEGFIIYSRTDILAEIDKYKINDEKVTTFLNDFKRKDSYARLEDDQVATVNTSSLSKCRHVSLVCQNINEETFKTLEKISELRTVLLIPDYGDSLKQIPPSFFEALTCMRTLDLSGSHISELPSSIGNMTHLHFLDLSFTLLERIPESITRLGELQTLKLKGCKHLHTLPKGMKQLRSLRHLDFDILGQLMSMPKGMGQLTKLRTLQAFVVSEEDNCSSLGELKNLNKLGGSFCISGLESVSIDDAVGANMKYKQLTELHFKWNDSVSYDDDACKKAYRVLSSLCPHYASLKELKFSSYPGSILTWWVKDKHFINLARLELISCKVEMFEAPDTLPNLKYLNITDMNGVKIIQGLHQGQRSDQKISFPMLETLIIDGMLNLESWTNIEEGDFPHLTKLSLMYCPKLTQLDFLSFLHSLTYLEISHCESFASLSSKPLPSLETLIINKCPALKKNYAPGKDGWKNIEDVPNIWIDMKGLGEKNQDTDLDDSDSSDEEIDHSNDSNKETDASKDVSDDVTMM